MRYELDPVRRRWLRRAVLGGALALGVLLALQNAGAPVAVAIAADTPAEAPSPPKDPAAAKSGVASKDAAAKSAAAVRPAAGKSAPATPDAASAADADDPDADASSGDATSEVTIGKGGIVVQKGGRRVNIRGLPDDREYDSFRDFVHDAPWLAALVFLLVLLFFLTPLLVLVLIIFYKMRKTRLQNETMLKLAERGIVPPAEAMQSLAGQAPGNIPPSAQPLYEQARQLRRRVAWSDLRKGVVLIAVGLGFIFYWMLNDGEASWVGLVCLFLGIGYCLLWFFEDRNTGPAPDGAGTPPAGSA